MVDSLSGDPVLLKEQVTKAETLKLLFDKKLKEKLISNSGSCKSSHVIATLFKNNTTFV